MKKTRPSERGQVLVIIAVAMIGLVGITGLAIDGSRAYADRRHAQNAADTAALAAALAYVQEGDYTAAGELRADSNGYDNNGTTNIVEVHYPPNEQNPLYNGNPDYMQVIITSRVDTFFGRVVGIEQMTNTVQAVVRVYPSERKEMFDGNAIVGLAPEECQAVKYQGNANTTLTGGGVLVNSNCPDQAFFNNSSSAALKAPSLTSVGGVDYKPGALDIPSINSGAQAYPYPPTHIKLPIIVCKDDEGNPVDAVVHGDIMSPGNWSGPFPPAQVTQLESGVYCVNGDFKLNANDELFGHDVVISMESGGVTWNGGATIRLDAPESGPFKGLLLYMPLSNSSDIKINGDSDSSFAGTILAPASPIQINGTGGADGFHCQVVGYTVDISGTSDMDIRYNDSENYDIPTQQSLEIAH